MNGARAPRAGGRRTGRIAAAGLAVALTACAGEPPTYTPDDLIAHLETNGIAVESTLDLAEVGAPSTVTGRTFLFTLSRGTELMVHVAADADRARRIVAVESGSSDVADRMGVGGADTYSTGWAFGNLAVLVKDGTPPERVEELERVLTR